MTNYVCEKCGGRWLPDPKRADRAACPWCRISELEGAVEWLPKTSDGALITLGMDIWKRGLGSLSYMIFHRQVAGLILDCDGWFVKTHAPGNPNQQTMTYPIEIIYSTEQAAREAGGKSDG